MTIKITKTQKSAHKANTRTAQIRAVVLKKLNKIINKLNLTYLDFLISKIDIIFLINNKVHFAQFLFLFNDFSSENSQVKFKKRN